MSDKPLDAIGIDSSAGMGKHDFVKSSPVQPLNICPERVQKVERIEHEHEITDSAHEPIEIAKLIASSLGYEWDTLYATKLGWIVDRGKRHDVNTPYKVDFLQAAKALSSHLRAPEQEANCDIEQLKREARFRQTYETLANDYCTENYQLFNAIAPLLGMKPFYGTCNKEQIIWADSQEEANALPAGASIFKYIKAKIAKIEAGKP